MPNPIWTSVTPNKISSLRNWIYLLSHWPKRSYENFQTTLTIVKVNASYTQIYDKILLMKTTPIEWLKIEKSICYLPRAFPPTD